MDKIILIMVICFSKTITRGSHPSNGLPISENLFNPLNLWLKNLNLRSIRSIVPQELVYIKTYPFGMIKLIQQIYGIYLNPHTGVYE